jgi:hypothetical protein
MHSRSWRGAKCSKRRAYFVSGTFACHAEAESDEWASLIPRSPHPCAGWGLGLENRSEPPDRPSPLSKLDLCSEPEDAGALRAAPHILVVLSHGLDQERPNEEKNVELEAVFGLGGG